jgi:hypothetical protein
VNRRNHISGWIIENVKFVGRLTSLRTQRLKMAAISMGKSNFIISAPPAEPGFGWYLLQIGTELLASELDKDIVQ